MATSITKVRNYSYFVRNNAYIQPGAGENFNSDAYAPFKVELIHWGQYPNWKKRISQQLDCTNDRTVRVGPEKSGSPLVLRAEYRDKGAGIADWRGEHSFFSSPRSTSVDKDKVERTAKQRLYDEFQQGVQLLPIAREAKRTLNMLANPFSSIQKAVGNYLRKDAVLRGSPQFKKRRKAEISKEYRKAASDAWLEFNFGVVPLLSDVKAAAEEVAKVVQGPTQKTFNVGFRETGTSGKFYPFGGITRQNRSNLLVESETQATYTVRYKGAYTPVMSGPVFVGGANLGLTLPDFLPSIWEAMPYSWLIDYFTNVGSILNGYAALSHVKINWLCKTMIEETNHYDSIFKDQPSNNYWWINSGFSPMALKTSTKIINRVGNPDISIPLFDFRADLSLSHSLNIASLVNSREADRKFAKALRS